MDDYISFEQIPFGTEDFALNPERRCPCMLLLDTSGSMSGHSIEQLNVGLTAFKDDLMKDSLASKRVEVSIITFGPVNIECQFQTADNFIPQKLSANGDTPIGAAITLGIDMVLQRIKVYKENGVGYYKPWVILVTDGAPTDNWSEAAQIIKENEEKNQLAFFSIAVDNADMDMLSKLSSVRPPLRLREHSFKEFFLWVSGSIKDVSRKNPGEHNKLLPPSGWAEI
ncbi:uncharacterized protein YegL [Mucilaginibacter gracilis]|uniref:Uncharacterized protein YegL n=1 Tax=Mucilaginibacter gracilis TaxID=423350 RepID=A0A495J1L4_9SPHI|nr:VWA domain-containing protein [Mucilaginibacter gracilis]RKR82817.1 uncharacterized protein YegL [Mucilaginibacter gracilis]